MPTQRLGKFLGYKPEVKPLGVRMTWNSSETLSERFCIAVSTTWTNLGAPSHRIPGSISPLDWRVIAHRGLFEATWKIFQYAKTLVTSPYRSYDESAEGAYQFLGIQAAS